MAIRYFMFEEYYRKGEPDSGVFEELSSKKKVAKAEFQRRMRRYTLPLEIEYLQHLGIDEVKFWLTKRKTKSGTRTCVWHEVIRIPQQS